MTAFKERVLIRFWSLLTLHVDHVGNQSNMRCIGRVIMYTDLIPLQCHKLSKSIIGSWYDLSQCCLVWVAFLCIEIKR